MTGAVLLLPMVYGIDPVVRGYAERFAGEGWNTQIWDPYPNRQASGTETYDDWMALESSLEDGDCQHRLRAEMDALAAQAPSIAVAGWCLGGRQALLLAAADPRVGACLAFYPTIRRPPRPGQIVDTIGAARSIAAPVLLAEGGLDQVTPRLVWPELEGSLRARAAPTLLLDFPEADHGFMDALRHDNPSNRRAAEATWPQALAFVRTSLLGGTA